MGFGEGVAREKFEGQNQVANLYIQRVEMVARWWWSFLSQANIPNNQGHHPQITS